MEVLKKLYASRAVWVAAAGLFSTVLLEGSDGSLSQTDIDQIIHVIKWFVVTLAAKWTAEDTAWKLPWQPPPQPPRPELIKPGGGPDHG